MPDHEALVDAISSLDFPHWMAEDLDPTWRTTKHHKLISEEIVKAVETGGRLIVTCPPQVGKSTLCAEWLPFWALANNPAGKTIIASYGHDLAARSSRRVREKIAQHGAQFGIHLAPGERRNDQWSTTRGGGIKAVGLNGGATGATCNGVMIIDDYCRSRADAESPTIREVAWETYSSSLMTRLAPGTPVVILATRWHPDDLIGRLLRTQGRVEDGGMWKLVHLPAIAEPHLTGGVDALGRKAGEPLSHPSEELDTTEKLLNFWQIRQRETPMIRDWRALYQGDPMEREGALVSWDVIHNATVAEADVPDLVRVVVAVDPAGGGGDEVGIITAGLGTDEKVYILADRTAVMPVTEWPLKVCEEADRAGADRIIMETNYGGDMVTQAVRSAWTAEERTNYRPSFAGVRALRGKVIRAEPIAQEMALGRVRIVAGLDKLASQWASYRAGDADSPGALDASVYAAMALLRSPMDGLVSEDADHGPRRRRTDVRRSGGRRVPGR